VSRQWPEAIRRRKAAEALRLYARLLVEYERVRRLRGGGSPGFIRAPGIRLIYERPVLWFNMAERRLAMTKAQQKVLDEALSLPVEARVALVESLLLSLNVPTQREIDELWAKEAERRVSQIDRGEVELVPGEQAFSRIRKKHKR